VVVLVESEIAPTEIDWLGALTTTIVVPAVRETEPASTACIGAVLVMTD
jgi:hypothetical protein